MGNHIPKYDDEFTKSCGMYQNGKSQTQIAREYEVSLSALSRWIRLFSYEHKIKTLRKVLNVNCSSYYKHF